MEIEYYNKSLQLKPKKNFTARYNLASALASREQYEPACRTFREAIEEARNDGEDDENIAKALRSLYQATAQLVRSRADGQSLSREQVLQQFREIMGADNFAKISAMAGPR